MRRGRGGCFILQVLAFFLTAGTGHHLMVTLAVSASAATVAASSFVFERSHFGDKSNNNNNNSVQTMDWPPLFRVLID